MSRCSEGLSVRSRLARAASTSHGSWAIRAVSRYGSSFLALSSEGRPYQTIVDRMRQSVATEFLENRRLGIEQVAERIGFADATSVRKAFKKWTGRAPSDFRSGRDKIKSNS